MHDMLRIMDVASALRRERETAESQLDVAAAKERLRERLLATAAAAGESVTPEEVDAAIEQYFAQQHRYEDPPPSWRRFRAHMWVFRHGLATLFVLIALLTWGLVALVGTFAGDSSPSPSPTPPAPVSQLPGGTITNPPTPQPPKLVFDPAQQLAAAWAEFQQAQGAAERLAADAAARERVQALARTGAAAHAAANLGELRDARNALAGLTTRLEETYTVRIVSRPGEDSGVERRHDGRTSGLYLIVEAVDGDGRIVSRRIRDAESGRQRDVTKWGEQVAEAVWNRVVADKQADGIVDAAEFARKARGAYDEVVVLDGGDGKPLRRGRQITSW
jgi:hypothetical protein